MPTTLFTAQAGLILRAQRLARDLEQALKGDPILCEHCGIRVDKDRVDQLTRELVQLVKNL